MVVEPGKYEICRAAWQAGNSRAYVVVLTLRSAGQASCLETQAGFLCYNLGGGFLLLQETLGCALKIII